jgi:hypothetical protein
MSRVATDLTSVTTVGHDIAKHIFQVHAVDGSGRVLAAKAVKRTEVLWPSSAFFRPALWGWRPAARRITGARTDEARARCQDYGAMISIAELLSCAIQLSSVLRQAQHGGMQEARRLRPFSLSPAWQPLSPHAELVEARRIVLQSHNSP